VRRLGSVCKALSTLTFPNSQLRDAPLFCDQEDRLTSIFDTEIIGRAFILAFRRMKFALPFDLSCMAYISLLGADLALVATLQSRPTRLESAIGMFMRDVASQWHLYFCGAFHSRGN